MQFKVIKYEKGEMYHICRDKDGIERRIDLLVSGDFPQSIDPESLVGKTVAASRTHVFLEIAHDVQIVE
jgi:hypothetical protein